MTDVSSVDAKHSVQEQLSVYRNALTGLDGIVAEINIEQQNVRLVPLRSVRNYKAQLEQSAYVNDELEKNDAQLDKARHAVANVTWYFNNQELSSRALEKQDPEVYGHWFAQAKQEWDNFAANKGLFSKPPTSPAISCWKRPLKAKSLPPTISATF